MENDVRKKNSTRKGKIKQPFKEKPNKKELKYSNQNLHIKEVQNFMTKKSYNSNINIINFQKDVMKYIKIITELIESTEEQKQIIIKKSERILNEHISRVERSDIFISLRTSALSHAAAIIYAVMVSHEKINKIGGLKMGKIIGVSEDVIPRLYRDFYKDIAHPLKFDF